MKNRPELDGLDELLKKSIAAFNSLAPEAKREMLRQQLISWVYGNLAIDNPNITREMVEKAVEDWS